MSIRRDFPDVPPIWALGVLAAQALAAWLLPLVETGPATRAIGWAAVAGGLCLIAWAAAWFRRKDTSIELRDVPRALIVEGPYRLNRNPIYSGMALFLIGAGLAMGAWSAALLALAFPPIVTRRFILGEEAALRAAFGPAAERYVAATRRW